MAKVKVLVQQSGMSMRYWAVTETGCKPFSELRSILVHSYEGLRDMFTGGYSEEEIKSGSRNIVGELLVECNWEEY